MKTAIVRLFLLAVVAVAAVMYCANPNPFDNTANASVTLKLRDSKGNDGVNLAVSDTVGNTVKVGVAPYLSNLIDSISVTVANLRPGFDTAWVMKNLASDSTLWYSFTFSSAEKCTVHVKADIHGDREYKVDGIITIYGKKVTPVIHPAIDTSAIDSIATFSVVATGDAPFTYQWYHGTALLSGKTDVSLVLSHLAYTDSGAYTCLVTDKWGDTATAAPAWLVVFQKTVVKTNTKPVLSVTGHPQILSAQICSLKVSAYDPDSGQTETFAMTQGPAGAVFSSLQFTWAPPSGYLGTDTMRTDSATFTVTDNGQPPLSDVQKVYIVVKAKILAPDSVRGITAVSRINGTFVFNWRKTVNADQYLIYRSKDSINFSQYATTLDTTFSNVIKDTTCYYYVVATSSQGSSAQSPRIRSSSVNAAPQWKTPTINAAINEGSPYSVDLADQVSDPNGDNVTLQLQDAGGVADSLAGTVWKYTPTYNDSGTHTIKIAAFDGMSTSVVTILVKVNNVPGRRYRSPRACPRP